MNEQGPGNDEYETPEWLFKALDSEFGFEHDGAATFENKKCVSYSDALMGDWPILAKVFCNPPYSNIPEFVRRALAHPEIVVLILPNRTDTDWFQELIRHPRVELRFFRKRIRFCLNGVEEKSPRFGTIIAVVRSQV